MNRFVDRLPDPEVLLALPIEELAGHLLSHIKQDKQGNFHPNNVLSGMFNDDISRGISGYPRQQMREISLAITEAFAWLEGQALIINDPGQAISSGWMTLSRRARAFKADEEYRDYVVARKLQRDLLHPSFAKSVWLAFARGDYAEAVFKAMRTVEIAVRDAAGLESRDIGVKLMRTAFGKGGALRDEESDPSEADALEHLFAGAVGSYKNPHSHRNVPLTDAHEVIEMVMLASHLLRIVDARRPAEAE